ncbi:uncharacterized protein BX664DRAFT_9253 [Halteromyces radiatus]|uniref:uncharacterized protein n=1 Tax=Halteromyces radiatus TaxID=101107 RepID=UPI00221FFDDF|nr:uncharacterized protein BX664DRAFT_9253 [Halteromyces radiatus]KAI8098894.1 hypothetical protein BX664DRAFT_9253 [Halteromyces radiatus]
MARTVQNFIRNKKLQKQQKLLQQEQDADTDDEQPANKRQKKAISKQTTKRRQSKDEKKEKQTANQGRQEALQLENPNRKPCPTCIAAGRHELAKTHSRSSSNLCPDQKKRQKVKNQELSGAPLRTHTIKHGLYGLLLDMTDDEKTQFVQGVETVVDFNRQLVIKGHLFLLYFFTYRLDAGLPLLSCFFQQAFFYGIFQLLLGGKFTNQSTFDAATRDNINFVFRRFIQQFPLARCEKVSSPIGRSPIAFSGVLSSTAQTYSTHLLSHVVENFDGFYIAYLQGRLRRMIPELAQNHAMQFAHFVYQSTVNDDKFPPVWPEIEYDPAIDDKLNESLLTIMDEASTEWNNIHELITTEEARRRSVQASRGSSIASSSTDPLPESMDIPSPASSVGSIGMTQLDLETPNPVHSAKSITTATISSYPEFFLPVMFDILRKMEQWNQIDSELPAIPQNEAKQTWTYHLLSGLPEWTRLDHRRRSSLTRAITNIINEGVRFIPEKLPAGFSAESIMHIQNAITTAQTEIREGRFAPPVYLTKQQARLFTIIPIPGLTRKYIHIDHQSLGTILKHFGLGRLASPSSTPIPPNQPHPNFNMFDLRKLKR